MFVAAKIHFGLNAEDTTSEDTRVVRSGRNVLENMHGIHNAFPCNLRHKSRSFVNIMEKYTTI